MKPEVRSEIIKFVIGFIGGVLAALGVKVTDLPPPPPQVIQVHLPQGVVTLPAQPTADAK